MARSSSWLYVPFIALAVFVNSAPLTTFILGFLGCLYLLGFSLLHPFGFIKRWVPDLTDKWPVQGSVEKPLSLHEAKAFEPDEPETEFSPAVAPARPSDTVPSLSLSESSQSAPTSSSISETNPQAAPPSANTVSTSISGFSSPPPLISASPQLGSASVLGSEASGSTRQTAEKDLEKGSQTDLGNQHREVDELREKHATLKQFVQQLRDKLEGIDDSKSSIQEADDLLLSDVGRLLKEKETEIKSLRLAFERQQPASPKLSERLSALEAENARLHARLATYDRQQQQQQQQQPQQQLVPVLELVQQPKSPGAATAAPPASMVPSTTKDEVPARQAAGVGEQASIMIAELQQEIDRYRKIVDKLSAREKDLLNQTQHLYMRDRERDASFFNVSAALDRVERERQWEREEREREKKVLQEAAIRASLQESATTQELQQLRESLLTLVFKLQSEWKRREIAEKKPSATPPSTPPLAARSVAGQIGTLPSPALSSRPVVAPEDVVPSQNLSSAELRTSLETLVNKLVQLPTPASASAYASNLGADQPQPRRGSLHVPRERGSITISDAQAYDKQIH